MQNSWHTGLEKLESFPLLKPGTCNVRSVVPQSSILLAITLLKAEQTHLFLDMEEPFFPPPQALQCSRGPLWSPPSCEKVGSDEGSGLSPVFELLIPGLEGEIC